VAERNSWHPGYIFVLSLSTTMASDDAVLCSARPAVASMYVVAHGGRVAKPGWVPDMGHACQFLRAEAVRSRARFGRACVN
jgi:hypothetical protein